jgi:hypothetical protein
MAMIAGFAAALADRTRASYRRWVGVPATLRLGTATHGVGRVGRAVVEWSGVRVTLG